MARDLYRMGQRQLPPEPQTQPPVGKSTKPRKSAKERSTTQVAKKRKKKPPTQVAKKEKLAKRKPAKQAAKKQSAPQATPPTKPAVLKLSPGMRASRVYEIVAPDISAIVKDKGPYPSLGSAAEAMRSLFKDRKFAEMSNSARKRWIKKHRPDWFVKA